MKSPIDEGKEAFLKILLHPDPSPEEERIKLFRRVMAWERA
jgi:hypothetical protein